MESPEPRVENEAERRATEIATIAKAAGAAILDFYFERFGTSALETQPFLDLATLVRNDVYERTCRLHSIDERTRKTVALRLSMTGVK